MRPWVINFLLVLVGLGLGVTCLQVKRAHATECLGWPAVAPNANGKVPAWYVIEEASSLRQGTPDFIHRDEQRAVEGMQRWCHETEPGEITSVRILSPGSWSPARTDPRIPVPEPSGLAMLAAGCVLLSVLAVGRRSVRGRAAIRL